MIHQLYDGDYALCEDHEGNKGIYVYSQANGFLQIVGNPMGPIVQWERCVLHPEKGYATRWNGVLISDEEIYGEDDEMEKK